MTRTEISFAIAKLIIQMNLDGLHPAIDYGKRSTEEQNRLFKAGASKLDGLTKISAHQTGRAFDVLLFDDQGKLMKAWPQEIIDKYHGLWESWGGKNEISWDVGHFEM